MGSSPPIPDESGFATPAAVVISLAVAVVALAVQSRAILEVHAAEADYARIAAGIQLDGAEALAADALYGGQGLSRPRAIIEIAGKPIEVAAEPEAGKMSLAQASDLGADTLRSLGAENPASALRRLQVLASAGEAWPGDISAADVSPLWKRCARSWISPYGGSLGSGGVFPPSRAAAHVGEVWRLVARTPDGWTEDRTVRITGEDHAPSRIIDRTLYRNPSGDESCRLAALPARSPQTPATP